MNAWLALLQKWLATSSPRQKWLAGLLALSLLATLAFLALTGDSASSNDPLETSPFYFAGVLLKLIGVLLLIIGGAALARRWMNLGPQGTRQRQLQLLETVRLSPRQALHLVKVGEQQIIIGATDQSIALLTQLEAGELPLVTETAQPLPAPDFGALLQSIKG